ncbi:hypothetical protein LOZ65_006936, partial [Ophidiomyces ophidiicola]
ALGQVNISSELPPPTGNVTTEHRPSDEPFAPDGQHVFSGPIRSSTITSNLHGYDVATLNETGGQGASLVEHGQITHQESRDIPTHHQPAPRHLAGEQIPVAVLQENGPCPPPIGINGFNGSMVENQMPRQMTIEGPNHTQLVQQYGVPHPMAAEGFGMPAHSQMVQQYGGPYISLEWDLMTSSHSQLAQQYGDIYMPFEGGL